MNKRIDELFKQAYGFPIDKLATINLEEFAELIVRECAGIADKAEPYKANDLIKQHFGVEL